MQDILVLQVVVIVCGTVGFVASLRFLRRYMELKHEHRIANRFMSKLLADRSAPPMPANRPERVITPH